MRITKLLFFCFPVLAAAVLTLAVTGCKSSKGEDPKTASGLPEVTLRARTANEVQAVAREFFVTRGYFEKQSKHAYEVVFDKPVKSGKSSKALRVRLRLHKQADGSWRLTGTPMGVEAWRSDLESEDMVPQGASQIQGFLVEIKNRVESGQ